MLSTDKADKEFETNPCLRNGVRGLEHVTPHSCYPQHQTQVRAHELKCYAGQPAEYERLRRAFNMEVLRVALPGLVDHTVQTPWNDVNERLAMRVQRVRSRRYTACLTASIPMCAEISCAHSIIYLSIRNIAVVCTQAVTDRISLIYGTEFAVAVWDLDIPQVYRPKFAHNSKQSFS